MSRASFTGTLSISMVGIAIKAYAVAQEPKPDVDVHLYHGPCLSKLDQQYVCSGCSKIISKEERSHGFIHDQQVYIIEEYEMQNVVPEPEEGRPITVNRVVATKELEALWFHKAFYLVPVGAHDAHAYSLFSRALKEEKVVAVVTYVSHASSHLGVVYPSPDGLILNTLHYLEAMRSLKDIGQEIVGAKLSAKEIKAAREIVSRLKGHKKFDIAAFKDEGRERFRLLIQAKIEHRQFAPGPIVTAPASSNLEEALRLSIKALKSKKAS